jgi:NAD(P)-dependent dehydrogenase (short-subunit alcohol dehydrogenase family)
MGAFQMVRACEGYMKKSGGGSIVNVSSIAGELFELVFMVFCWF